jgi:hypothetical protein
MYGTLSVLDTLRASSTTSVIAFGEDRAYEAVSLALDAHNRILDDIAGNLVESTADRLRRTGANDTMTAEDLDEYGVPAPQKMSAGANVGFPLRRHGNALQWTRDWFDTKTPAELAGQIEAMMDADTRAVMRDIKRAIFVATNYTFTDRLIDAVDLPVKRLANADSHPIPPGPDGEAFTASSHTHYIARVSTLAASDITAVINTVREHFATGMIELDINAAQEAAIRGFTSNFVPYYDGRLIVADSVTRGAASLDVVNTYDRAIGIFDTAEVHVKPWVPANYILARLVSRPVLAARSRTGNGLGALELVADFEQYPLRSRMWRRDLGFGVQDRVAAAVLYIGGTSYVSPTIT